MVVGIIPSRMGFRLHDCLRQDSQQMRDSKQMSFLGTKKEREKWGRCGHMCVECNYTYILYMPVHGWVAQLCLTLCDFIDCSLPGSSVHGILQARILEWLPFSSPSWPRDWTRVSCIAGRFFTIWATREALYIPMFRLLDHMKFQNCALEIVWEKWTG